MRILNLYAGIGGNRKLWGGDIMVTAVEINPEIAKIYQDFFPQDTVIVGDAHQYLLDHYKEFDFIWSSPPCPTHSVTNFFLNAQGTVRYPDMSLWQEIIFLNHFFKGKWVVENVEPYYNLKFDGVEPYHNERHYFWSNFKIPNNPKKNSFNICNMRKSTRELANANLKDLQKLHGFDLSNYKFNDTVKILRNCVNPRLGLKVFECAFNTKQMQISEVLP